MDRDELHTRRMRNLPHRREAAPSLSLYNAMTGISRQQMIAALAEEMTNEDVESPLENLHHGASVLESVLKHMGDMSARQRRHHADWWDEYLKA